MNCNFEIKTYNGISIIVNNNDGYINASQMCSSNGKFWRHYKNTKMWKSITEAFDKRYLNEKSSYYIDKVSPQYQGEYIHPKLVHFVAEYCSVDYAFAVAELMDSINNKVHDVLEKQHLQDTVENAKPVFNEAVKRISLKIDIDLHNSRCWGVRDDIHRLDSYERDDLQRDIDKYNNIKKQLDEARNKLSEWNDFIPTYHPDFEY